jgi:hypothetical protein
VIVHVLVNLADGRALLGEPKHINRKHLLVGKVRVGVVALPLCDCGETSPVAAADEQVDPKVLGSSVHVAKGGLLDVGCIFFQAACGDVVFQPLIGINYGMSRGFSSAETPEERRDLSGTPPD